MDNMILLGDVAFTGILSSVLDQNQIRLKEISPVLNQNKMVFANLEVPIRVSNEKNEHKSFIHYSLKKNTTDLLKKLNIGCVSLANNHIYDCKMSGLKATIAALDNQGIYHTGAGWKKEHIEPVIFEVNNKSVAFLAYVDTGTNPETEKFSELLINYFSIEKVINDIEVVVNKVDKVIVSIHWGIDYSTYPTRLQQVYARKIIDSGANIILGHHPHTLQPYEEYKDGYIFYSLGGLTFGDYYQNNSLKSLPRKTKKGVIVEVNDNNSLSWYGTKELKGNIIKLRTFDYQKWSNRRLKEFYLIDKYIVIKKLINMKENIIDPSYEYFFGYYNHPLKRLFQISNLKKVKRLFQRYKNQNSKKI